MKIFTRTPFDALIFEKAADEGHFVDEFTVLREIALNTGKTLILGLIIILSPFVSIQWIFILGALAAISFNFWRMEKTAS